MAKHEPDGAEKPPQTGRPFDYEAIRSRLDGLLRKQLFFVGGLAKSGTTWVQLLLDSHPQVSCLGECHLVDRLFPALKGTLEEHNRFLAGKAATVFAELARGFPAFELAELECLFATAILLLLAKRGEDKAALAVGEKTPENVQVFGGLIRLFPGAKCIHVVRDPRDAAVSAWYHVLRVMPEETHGHFADMPQYLRYYTDRWVSEVEMGVRFGARNPASYLEVSYESIAAEPERALATLFRFLGVDDGAETVRRCIASAAFERLSGGRARGLENRASLFRKGVSGDWKSHFDAATLGYVIDKAGPLMRRFGYV
jgi:hypothetical protein